MLLIDRNKKYIVDGEALRYMNMVMNHLFVAIDASQLLTREKVWDLADGMREHLSEEHIKELEG
jgi:hypothetical protein